MMVADLTVFLPAMMVFSETARGAVKETVGTAEMVSTSSRVRLLLRY